MQNHAENLFKQVGYTE